MESARTIATRSALFGIIINFFLAIIKGIVGFFGNSYALIADAIESTTDIFASILVMVGLRYSTKPADENHPYGHGRAEPLFTFIVVGFLVVSATIIAFQSIINLKKPQETPELYTLFVLGGIILIKELSYRYVKFKSKKINSSTLEAEAWHHRSDAISSLFAFVGISIAIAFGKGFEIADDIAALFASFFILYNAYKIFRPALGEIMDEQIFHELEAEVRQKSLDVKGVLDIEKCVIRKVGMHYFIDLHVVVDGHLTVAEGHLIGHQLEEYLFENITEIHEVLTHVEPNFWIDSEVDKTQVNESKQELD